MSAAAPGRIVGWRLEPGAGVDLLEAALLDALAGTHEALVEAGEAAAIVLAVQADVATPLGRAFAATAAGFGRALAREQARHGATVNTVGMGDDEDPRDHALVNWLISPEGRFVTGQSFGTAADRLTTPRRAGPAEWLEGRTALVSGGGGDIGSAITHRLAADGWNLVIGTTRLRHTEPLLERIQASGRACGSIRLDLTAADQIEAAPRSLDDLALGPLQALVLVGGWNRTAPFVATDHDEWLRTLAINLTGPARLIASLRTRLTPSGGVIVSIASESGRIGDAGRAVYSGAKAGIAALCSEVNGEPPLLRGVTISPGPVDTPLLHETHDDEDAAARGIERLRRLVPLGRLGLPQEVASAVALACSPSSQALGGEVISVGGGVSMV